MSKEFKSGVFVEHNLPTVHVQYACIMILFIIVYYSRHIVYVLLNNIQTYYTLTYFLSTSCKYMAFICQTKFLASEPCSLGATLPCAGSSYSKELDWVWLAYIRNNGKAGLLLKSYFLPSAI